MESEKIGKRKNIKSVKKTIKSFTNQNKKYELDLLNNTCTCPNYVYVQKAKGGMCKHLLSIIGKK